LITRGRSLTGAIGRHTGIITEVPDYALVFTFRGGKVVRWRFFPDLQAAFEAVGLGG
jgi:ketosteroid isomerase-like protein